MLKTASTAGLSWAPGLEGPAGIEKLLESWNFLPAGKPGDRASAVQLYIDQLKRMCADTGAPLTLGQLPDAQFPWIAGVRALPWTTNHFSLPMGELEPLVCPSMDVSERLISSGAELVRSMIGVARQQKINHLACTVDSADVFSQLSLQQAGFFMIDSLVTHHITDLKNADKFDSDQSIRPMTEAETEAVAEIAAVCFGKRDHNINRYNADAAFDPQRTDEMYRMWIRNSMNRQLADEVLIYIENGRPAGFITLQLATTADKLRDKNIGHVPLNAVHPDFHMRGIYDKLVRAGLKWFHSNGMTEADIKTQLPNNGVHRVWGRLGARLNASVHRFHYHGK